MPPKNRVSAEAGERILAALRAIDAAKDERDQAVADALKAGASVREVAALSGLSTSTVQKLGRANGWPTAAQQKQWADEKAHRDQWDSLIKQRRAAQPDL